MSTLIINSSFKDCIDRIIFYKNHKPPTTKEISLNDDDTKEEIINAFTTCINFSIKEEYIDFELYTSDEEKKEHLQDYENTVTYSINSLKKWYNNKEENKTQIEIYLKAKNLDWILDKLIN